MIMSRKFLLTLLLCSPLAVFADGVDMSALQNAQSIEEAVAQYKQISNEILDNVPEDVDVSVKNEQYQYIQNAIEAAKNGIQAPVPNVSESDDDDDDGADEDGSSQSSDSETEDTETTSKPSKNKDNGDTRSEEEKAKALAEKQKALDAAKENENSLENRMLGGATMAATGLGGMELAMGLAEQRADDEAAQDMAAYLATFRCSYGNGHSVKAGPDPIELPGGTNEELNKLRTEYITLAASLKERKESLGMKPGIESEEILDKATTGLYDDENVGISGGAYGSLYRATALNSEADQAKLKADQDKSANRVKTGGTIAGTGVAGGIAGNSLLNGKLGDVINGAKDNLLPGGGGDGKEDSGGVSKLLGSFGGGEGGLGDIANTASGFLPGAGGQVAQ